MENLSEMPFDANYVPFLSYLCVQDGPYATLSVFLNFFIHDHGVMTC